MTSALHRRATGRRPTDEAELAELLERAAREHGFIVTIDSYVGEACAATLLGRSQGTIRNWRSGASPLPYRRLGGRRGRVGYSLLTLARFLLDAESREYTEAHETASTPRPHSVIVRAAKVR